jgi:non-specific serine/threonine protein kinase
VLDNCEHLIDASAQLVHSILAHCPEVRVAATSREVLGLPGEVVWRVPSLSLPPPGGVGVTEMSGSDAVALFCDRDANAVPVVKICRRLDGIPLALELAAARLRMLSAHQVAEHLDDRFRLLTGGARTAVPRHQTLRAAMDWSYEGLPQHERAVLRRLAVFAGSFDLDAAEAVARDEGGDADAVSGFEVLHLLSRLVDKSLVGVQAGETEVRYRLLETVRQYTAERLTEAGESRAVHRRHRDHFLRPREMRGDLGWWPDDEHWLRRLEADEDNFRAALLWSLEEADEEPALHLCALMWTHWMWDSPLEGVGWLEQALAGPGRVATPTRVFAMVELAVLLAVTEHADLDRSARVLDEALEMADRLGERNGQVLTRYFLAEMAIMRGATDRARQLIVASLERYDEGNLVARGWCLYVLASAAIAGGTANEAMPYLEQALDLARRWRMPVLTAHALATLAPLAALAGDAQRATNLADEALRAAARLKWRNIRAMALTRASEAGILSQHPDARATLCQLLRLLGDMRTRSFVADALEMAALVAEQVGRLESAARLLGSAEVLRDTHGEPFGGTRALSPAVRACPPRVLEVLGAARYDEERATGRRMTAEEAIAYALVELESERV